MSAEFLVEKPAKPAKQARGDRKLFKWHLFVRFHRVRGAGDSARWRTQEPAEISLIGSRS